jgi:hypothetical protein
MNEKSVWLKSGLLHIEKQGCFGEPVMPTAPIFINQHP